MISEIDVLLGQYRSWLKEKTAVKQVGEWAEITTPFLDRHNDCIQIYARREGHSWILTDDGYTLGDLEASGCEIGNSAKRQVILKSTLRAFGVSMDSDSAMTVAATDAEFAFKKHNLIQAILGVGDMFYLAQSKVANLFSEDVKAWLDQSDIRYTQDVKITGKSGYDHYIDFIIPRSLVKPERIVRVINKPTKDQAEAVCFAWIEIQDERPPGTLAYAVINNSDRDVPAAVPEALAAYKIAPILWSKREDSRQDLAA